jgi:hypothetical protein
MEKLMSKWQVGKSASALLLLIFCNQQAKAGALDVFVNNGFQWEAAFSSTDQFVNEAIQIIEKQVSSPSAKVRSLPPRDRKKAIRLLIKANDSFHKAQRIGLDVRRGMMGLGTIAHDQIRSLNTVLEGHREISKALIELIDPKASLADVLGNLKQSRFIVANLVGNVITSLENAVGEISDLPLGRAYQIGGVQNLFAVFKQAFERSKERLDKAEAGIGPRIVWFVDGSTFGMSSEEGPSSYSAAVALEVEQELLEELHQDILWHETIGPLAGWIKYGQKSKEECDAFLGGGSESII